MDLVASVVTFCHVIPKGIAGRHLANQLLRSGTSPAPNYAEARGAESDRDFLHKLRVVLKELNETEVWLQIIIRTQVASPESVQSMREECTSLSRIIAASIKTLRQRGVTSG